MEEEFFKPRTDLGAIFEAAEAVRTELSKVIVGQEEMIEYLLAAILVEGHVLIEGVPGIAKTLTAKMLGKSIKADFSRIQFTPDLMPSDVLGTSIFDQRANEFSYKKGPIFSQIVLIDEINRAPAKTQAALFEVMEERQVTTDGHAYQMKRPFIVIATQNPIEQEGTYRLPEAQLDRFLFKIIIDYPGPEQELMILKRHHANSLATLMNEVNPVLDTVKIEVLSKLAEQVKVEEQLLQYITQIVLSTRNHRSLYLGASPRATIGILVASRAIAALRGRDFVTPEDIAFTAVPVLRHRIMLTPEREMDGISTDTVIQEIIQSIEIPR